MANSTDYVLSEEDPDAIDMHVARILAMSPEELRADIIARGEDPDTLADSASQEYERAVAKVNAMRRGLS